MSFDEFVEQHKHDAVDSAQFKEMMNHIFECNVYRLILNSANYIVDQHRKELDKLK